MCFMCALWVYDAEHNESTCSNPHNHSIPPKYDMAWHEMHVHVSKECFESYEVLLQ